MHIIEILHRPWPFTLHKYQKIGIRSQDDDPRGWLKLVPGYEALSCSVVQELRYHGGEALLYGARGLRYYGPGLLSAMVPGGTGAIVPGV